MPYLNHVKSWRAYDLFLPADSRSRSVQAAGFPSTPWCIFDHSPHLFFEPVRTARFDTSKCPRTSDTCTGATLARRETLKAQEGAMSQVSGREGLTSAER